MKETVFSREHAMQKSVEYFNGDELAATVFINKYALKDSAGNLYESDPDMMHHRLARELARIEATYPNSLSEQEIYDLIKGFKYIVPQGSPMAGIGNNKQIVSISNCFVVRNPEGQEDSYGAIFKIDERIAQLQKRRCGVGTDISGIRPAGVAVNNAAITSTGMIPFAERYSNTTREVAQGGRRGALMISASIRHPEAEKFIDAKLDSTKITGANISVKIHDDFMQAVIANKPYMQQWPITGEPIITQEIDAAALWKKIIHNAWKSAEPGVLFWDKIIAESPADLYAHLGFKTVSTNPCGELPLCSGDSCRLLVLNLFSYVTDPFTSKAKFDFDLFKKHVRIAQRLMDDIVDLELEKIDSIIKKVKSDPENEAIKRVELEMWKEIRQKCEQGRRTGTGVTAEGDMLAALNITYGTKKATNFAELVHKHLAIEAYKSSCILAKERGAFPIYDAKLEKSHPFLDRLRATDAELDSMMRKYGRRNIALLTMAPTGTVSIMTQTTSGGESVFAIFYGRNRKVNPNDRDVKVAFVDQNGDAWESYSVFHHHFKTWMKVNGYDVEKVSKMSKEEIEALIEKSPYHKATANDIDWVEKVKMQGAIQKWIDHSISVTVNLPNSVTEELVNDVYIAAWKAGCKGCTIYRDGSRTGVLVTPDDKAKDATPQFKENMAPKRPKTLECNVHRFVNKGERWVGFVGILDGRPYEIFTGSLASFGMAEELSARIEVGKIRKNKLEDGTKSYDFIYEENGEEKIIPGLNRTFDPTTYDMSRTFSAVLRHGMPLPYIVAMIETLHLDGDLINTWKSSIKRILKKYIPDGTEIKTPSRAPNCPNPENEEVKCNLEYQEGCLICTTCGNSKCG